MKYYIIGDEDTVLGFSLVGLEGCSVSTEDQARKAFEKALENEENQIILITEDVSDMMSDLVNKYLFSESFPLIVLLPSSKEGKYKKDLRQLVNEAIGVSL